MVTSRYPVGISTEFCFRWQKKQLQGGKGKGIRGKGKKKNWGKKLKETKGRYGKEKKIKKKTMESNCRRASISLKSPMP